MAHRMAGARVHWKATWTAIAEIQKEDFKGYNAFDEVGPRLDPEVEQTKTIEGDTKARRARVRQRLNVNRPS